MMRSSTAAIACFVGVVMTVSVVAQERGGGRGAPGVRLQSDGPLSDTVIANAPFSAEAVTTVTQTLADGTKIEQRVTAKWYRDSLGRVRREQNVIGLDRLDPVIGPSAAWATITFDSVPGDPSPYTLTPATKTARRAPRGVQWLTRPYLATDAGRLYFNNGTALNDRVTAGDLLANSTAFRRVRLLSSPLQTAPIPADLKPTEEQLGSRQIEGVKATGYRSTTTIPAGRIGNDRPIQVVEEQWDSPELNMVVFSRFSDPRTGVVEYRLTNLNRSEPRADLFQVPSDYTVVDDPVGLRTGGAGGRGAIAPAQGGRGGRGN